MIILFQSVLFLKQYPTCNGCFALFTKIKEGSWTGFGCITSAWFFHVNISYVILYQLTKFQCHIFLVSSRCQTKCVIRILFRHMLTSKTLRFILNHPLSQWLTGKNWGEVGNTKFEYLINEKSFLDEIKRIFHNYLKTHSQVCNNVWQL